MIDWNAIEDRTREVNTHAAWDDAAHIVADLASNFQVDLWEGQHYRPAANPARFTSVSRGERLDLRS